MNNIEAKIKQLGLPIEVIEDKWEGRFYATVCDGGYLHKKNGKRANFTTEKQAYNWIAKEFNLERLVSKDEVIKEFKSWINTTKSRMIGVPKNTQSYGEFLGSLSELNDVIRWLEDK